MKASIKFSSPGFDTELPITAPKGFRVTTVTAKLVPEEGWYLITKCTSTKSDREVPPKDFATPICSESDVGVCEVTIEL